MHVIEEPSELLTLDDNVMFGCPPEMVNSTITIKGKNNVLFIEEGVKLRSSKITFEGNNGLIMLGKNRHYYVLDISINNNCSVILGRNIYFNGACHIIVSEQCSVVMGDDCLVSFEVWIRTADPHLVYDSITHKRINASRNVYIGDHVWLGQHAFVLKGTTVGSGSIIGAMSLVAGKTIPSNESWGGNPAKQIKRNVFWEESCVHTWTSKKTKKHAKWEGNEFIFEPSNDSLFSNGTAFPKGSTPALDRLDWYRGICYENSVKNRFFIDAPQQPGRLQKLKRLLR